MSRVQARALGWKSEDISVPCVPGLCTRRKGAGGSYPFHRPYSGDGIVGWFGVLGVLHSGKFMQVPLRFGRQFVHGWPAAFTHTQFIPF